MAHSPVDHVMDTGPDPEGRVVWEFFHGVELPLPSIFGFQITKFMILELIAAGLILLIYIPLARRARNGTLPKGAWWNCFESLLTFVRNEIAKPNLDPPAGHDEHAHDAGHGHDHKDEHHHEQVQDAGLDDRTPPRDEKILGLSEADMYVPFLWTLFLFVLFCNLLGMFPFLGSPTANIFVTGALALCAFSMMHGAPLLKMGPAGYLKSMWPHIEIDMPGGKVMSLVFGVLLFVIELFGTFIKGGVLAVRLFANMFAGHMVLATILLFIITVGELAGRVTPLWGTVTVASVLGVTALSLLELFVAFLQAYVFTFLTALFMGMALHPQH